MPRIGHYVNNEENWVFDIHVRPFHWILLGCLMQQLHVLHLWHLHSLHIAAGSKVSVALFTSKVDYAPPKGEQWLFPFFLDHFEAFLCRGCTLYWRGCHVLESILSLWEPEMLVFPVRSLD